MPTNTAAPSASPASSRALSPAPSLHRRIAAALYQNIVSGKWPPGFRLPPEPELAALYECSRMTLTQALVRLADAAIIERRRGVGSFVLHPGEPPAVLQITDIAAEVAALGVAYRFEVIARRRKADGARAARDLGLPAFDVAGGFAPGQPVLEVRCRHFAGRTPFCFEERLINLAAAPGAADERFTTLPPGAWLVQHTPWTQAEHRISADTATAVGAAALKIRAQAPCLVLKCRLWSRKHTMAVARLTYPGRFHRLVARFTPAGPHWY